MKAHELARKLLAGHDLEVVHPVWLSSFEQHDLFEAAATEATREQAIRQFPSTEWIETWGEKVILIT